MVSRFKIIAGVLAVAVCIIIIIIVSAVILRGKSSASTPSSAAPVPSTITPPLSSPFTPPLSSPFTPPSSPFTPPPAGEPTVTVVIPPGVTVPPPSTETKPLQEISQPIRSSGCEGDTVKFSCPTGKTIQIANTFYGRNSPSVCPGPGSDKTTTCNALGAQATLVGILNGKNNATLKMANVNAGGPFMDPCGGVFKHYDVTYNCV